MHCGKTEHIIETCFKNHGFPPHFEQGPVINNCVTHNTNEDDSQFIAYEDDHRELDTSKLSFTPNQHKVFASSFPRFIHLVIV